MSRVAWLPLAAAVLLGAGCVSRITRPSMVRLSGPDGTGEPVIAPSADASSPVLLPCGWELGIPFAEVMLDGRGPHRFLFDTGAGLLAFDVRLAGELGLKRRNLAADGPSLRVDDGKGRQLNVRETAYANELRVGPFTLPGVEGALVDLTGIERACGIRIDGILPAAVFRGGLLTFDFAARSATYAAGRLDPDAAGVQELLDLHGDVRPFVEIDVAGTAVPALIDTGHSGAIDVPDSLESSLRLHAPPVEVGRHQTVAGMLARRAARMSGSVGLAGCRIDEPIVQLHSGSFAILGSDVLRGFRTTLDFASGLAQFTRSGDEPLRSPPVRSVGAGWIRDEGAWRIAYVLNGSPAERAGLAAGEVVESLDGRPAGDVGYQALRELSELRNEIRMRVVGASGPRDVVVEVATLVQ